MFGRGGKPRTSYGRFLDRHQVQQEDVCKATGLSRNTVSDACSNLDYTPRRSTMTLLLQAAKKLTGKTMKREDFWI
ncbi:hypothetical protein J31TS4_15720 [Paenibacillus sp. J31TS4]|nr:hypothetical protein J31TS4_15720 [Paenibacillus sp. J31TS4]